jgi:hypothetical protein
MYIYKNMPHPMLVNTITITFYDMKESLKKLAVWKALSRNVFSFIHTYTACTEMKFIFILFNFFFVANQTSTSERQTKTEWKILYTQSYEESVHTGDEKKISLCAEDRCVKENSTKSTHTSAHSTTQ